MVILNIIVLILFLTSVPVFSQDAITHATPTEQEQAVDWASVDVALYNNLKSQGTEDSEIFQAMGYAHFQNKQWDRAENYFKKAVALNPDLYWSWYNLGLLNMDTEEGYGFFEQATRANPEFSISYYWMAYYRCRTREDDKAIPLFKKYIETAKAENNDAEQGRVKVAEEVLSDLLAGREGKSLSMMRRQEE